MKRSVAALADREYDLVIVGGGIFGICAAWDATLRGLSVALVERGDFAHATSASCFKIVHGGLRYLQHADLHRIRESSRERNSLLRIAPHLVRPLPVVVPTYGRGLRGKGLLRAGLLAYDLLTFDRNRGITDPQRRIPRGYAVSREECLGLFPGLESKGLTGGMVFHDGQMYSPARLALSYLKSAVRAGAQAANYVGATNFLCNGNRVLGIEAEDLLTGEKLNIRGRVVLNAAGPWAEHLLKLQMGLRLDPELTYSRDAYIVTPRRISNHHALALQARTKDPDAMLSRGNRHLLLIPWRGYTLIGVWHQVHRGRPGEFTVTEEEIRGFLDEVNEAYPMLQLGLKDVSMWSAGLILFGHNRPGATDLSYGKRSELVDHATAHGVDRLVTMIGVRFTTSRGVAEKAVDLVYRKLGKVPPKSRTATLPISGGDIGNFDAFLRSAVAQRPAGVRAETMHALVLNHGSECGSVLGYIQRDPLWAEGLQGSTTIKAEVAYAVDEEKAQKLADVVFRRTDLGAGGYPGKPALRTCADIMASKLGWHQERVEDELAEVEALFPSAALSDRGSHSGNRPGRAFSS